MIDSEGCEENDAIFINMTLTLDLKILNITTHMLFSFVS